MSRAAAARSVLWLIWVPILSRMTLSPPMLSPWPYWLTVFDIGVAVGENSVLFLVETVGR